MEIEDAVFSGLLSFYPEERLLNREKFAAAKRDGVISFSELKSESETLFIPWQMFFLNSTKLKKQLNNIESNRADKISLSFMSRRPGRRGAFSMRLIDKFVRIQSFLTLNSSFPINQFPGSLKDLSVPDSVNKILEYFSIDIEFFRTRRTVKMAIDYLIDCLAKKNINVAQGTTAYGLMPRTESHAPLYKNLSGFCLKDARVPFIYLSTNEVSDEEPVGRQIYTLIYLISMIGLDIYSLAIKAKSVIKIAGGDRRSNLANEITSELLMPKEKMEEYRHRNVTQDDLKAMCLKYKVTPRAALYRLKKERIINQQEYDDLIEENPYIPSPPPPNGPKLETSVKKLVGELVFGVTNNLVGNKTISPVQAQIIMFGRPDTRKWIGYRSNLGI
ncbi:MAG TPA: hypothetical protein VIR98_03165 [Candidatus Paceibacterota bacterium]